MGSDPDGLFGVIYAEELHWGCAGIALAISGLRRSPPPASPPPARPSRSASWVPECFGTATRSSSAPTPSPRPAPAPTSSRCARPPSCDGDEWVLNGTKVFISNGGIADVTVVVATVDPELGHRGQASFVVPKDTPGLSQGKKEDKIGIRASQTAEVVLEDCRIPVDYLLGGMEKLDKKLERARSGQNGRRLERARDLRDHPPAGRRLGARHRAGRLRVDARVPRGQVRRERRPLLEQQRIQQMLADVATEIEAARLLVWRAAWMGRNGVPMTGGQGSMSKLKAGDVTMWATTTLMDLVGAVRADHRVPAREVVPRRQDLPALRGHGPGPAAGDLAHAAPSTASSNGAGAEVLEQAPGNATGDQAGAQRAGRGVGARPRASQSRGGVHLRPRRDRWSWLLAEALYVRAVRVLGARAATRCRAASRPPGTPGCWP